MEVRLDAVINPTPIGMRFYAQLRDTWITTGPPESQIVPWVFVLPSGEVYKVQASYLDDYTWEVDFIPDEVGRWVYLSLQQFIEEPHERERGPR